MEPPLETPWDQRLKRLMNDLVSLLALPAIWVGGDPKHIASTLLDVLSAMLPVDFVYARLFDGERPNEIVRVGQAFALGVSEIGKRSTICLEIRNRIGCLAPEWMSKRVAFFWRWRDWGSRGKLESWLWVQPGPIFPASPINYF